MTHGITQHGTTQNEMFRFIASVTVTLHGASPVASA